MSIIVSGISLPFEVNENEAISIAAKKLNTSADCELNIVRRSIDARKKPEIKMVYSVSADFKDNIIEQKIINKLQSPQISLKSNCELEIEINKNGKECRPVIVGFGPAGMFCALLLARQGFRPIVIERGEDVDSRVLSVKNFFEKGKLNFDSNVQYGEGGAGTFSDGKLTTRINDERCSYVLSEFHRFGAPKNILIDSKPHVGTDLLRGIIKNIRKEIIKLGGEVIFNCALTHIVEKGECCEIKTSQNESLITNALVLAIGHSARDTVEYLFESGFTVMPKAFSCGVRIEQSQRTIDFAMYGKAAGNPLLPPAEYQFSKRKDARGVYTFCMCPGGTVVAAASEQGRVVTNGMSQSSRNGENANSAIVVAVGPDDFGNKPLDGIAFQRKLEKAAFEIAGSNYYAPYQTVNGYLFGKSSDKGSFVSPTYKPGVTQCDLNCLFPSFINDYLKMGLCDFENKAKGFALPNAILTGVETRTSSPVRLLRTELYTAIGKNMIYPCGEGAGYAGGIISSAVDGIKVALAIAKKFKPKEGLRT